LFSVADVEARVRRLEELTRGLSKEVALWKDGNDPLLYLERRAYLNAVQDALAGLEAARVVLARAAQRTRRDAQRAAEPGGAAGPGQGQSA
jgi:hypothetical protein